MIDILRARQNLVMMESNFPQDAVETFEKMENYGNPWGLSPQDRENWMDGLDVPLMREKKNTEVLYWAGCSGAYDSRGREISQSVAKILNEAKLIMPALEMKKLVQETRQEELEMNTFFKPWQNRIKKPLNNITSKK